MLRVKVKFFNGFGAYMEKILYLEGLRSSESHKHIFYLMVQSIKELSYYKWSVHLQLLLLDHVKIM